jgi:dTMP kinase
MRIRVMYVGYFISFEGVEGCGKTTQIKLLSELLSARSIRSVLTREPGGCPIADKIRAILLDAENRALSPLAELMLYAAARAQHVTEVIAPALEAGKIVLCDRFCDATVAYQSFGRGIDRVVIETLNLQACQGITPNLTILVDCDPAVGLERARRRIEASSGPREERFELEALAFHSRVRAGYQQLAADEPDRFLIIDGSGTIEENFAAISTQVVARIPEALRAVC